MASNRMSAWSFKSVQNCPRRSDRYRPYVFFYFLQFNQQSFPIQKKGITSFMSRVKFYDAVGCIRFIFLFQTVDTFFYFEQICINVLFSMLSDRVFALHSFQPKHLFVSKLYSTRSGIAYNRYEVSIPR